MSDTITYQYATPSSLSKTKGLDELFLAKYSEIEKKNAPCFFWGKLTDPALKRTRQAIWVFTKRFLARKSFIDIHKYR